MGTTKRAYYFVPLSQVIMCDMLVCQAMRC